MERLIEIKQRGLTPRNISPQKKSSIIQIAAQYQSDSKKRQGYESIVKERLLETDNGDTGNNRIIGIEDLRDGVATTLCRPCVEAKIQNVEEDTILEFEKYFMEKESSMSSFAIFKAYKELKIKSKKRKLGNFLAKATMIVNDKTIGQSSNITLNCNNKPQHKTPINKLLDRRMTHKRGRLGKHNTNLRIMMAPFFAGIGPLEMTDVANVLDLPNSMNLDRTIRRHQPEIGNAIIKISEREMRIAMSEEIRQSIVSEKGEEYYKTWVNLPLADRDTIGLVISYDMG